MSCLCQERGGIAGGRSAQPMLRENFYCVGICRRRKRTYCDQVWQREAGRLPGGSESSRRANKRCNVIQHRPLTMGPSIPAAGCVCNTAEGECSQCVLQLERIWCFWIKSTNMTDPQEVILPVRCLIAPLSRWEQTWRTSTDWWLFAFSGTGNNRLSFTGQMTLRFIGRSFDCRRWKLDTWADALIWAPYPKKKKKLLRVRADCVLIIVALFLPPAAASWTAALRQDNSSSWQQINFHSRVKKQGVRS